MKQAINDGLKMVFNHFLIICVTLLAAMGFIKLFSHNTSGFVWYFPFEVLGVSASTAVLSLVFVSAHEQTRKEFVIRCIIHLFLLIGVVLLEGYAFKWWSETIEMIVVLCVLLFVYICVWLFSAIIDKRLSNNINTALKNINKKEK